MYQGLVSFANLVHGNDVRYQRMFDTNKKKRNEINDRSNFCFFLFLSH